MNDRFEARLVSALDAYSRAGVRPIDALAVSEAAASAERPRARRFGFATGLHPAIRIAAAVALLVALLGAIATVGAILEQRRDQLPGGNGSIILPLANGNALVAVASDGSRTDLPIPVHSRSCATFSPDGRTLAYLSPSIPTVPLSEHLAISNVDGSGQRVLWSGRFNDQTFHQVIWSRDSRSVVATHASSDTDPGTGDRIIVGHRDGSPATVLDWSVGESPDRSPGRPMDGSSPPSPGSTTRRTRSRSVASMVAGPARS
jgi:hypothetical protein